MRAVLVAGVIVGMLIIPAHAEDTPYPMEKLDGIEMRCAKDIAGSAWDALRTQSWAQLAKLLSLSGAAEMFAVVGGTIQAELRGCFADVYRLGVEDGQLKAKLERAQETTR